MGRASFVVASLVILGILAVEVAGYTPEFGYTAGYMAYRAAHAPSTWAWVLFWFGLAKARVNFSNRLLNYVREATFPYYMLHYLPVTVLSFYGIRMDGSVLMKFLMITVPSVPITLILYEVLIKRIRVMRFLSGLKPLTAPEKPSTVEPSHLG